MTTTIQEKEGMALVKLMRSGQVTLPADLRQRFRLGAGDYLEAEATERGILLKPVSVIGRTQALERMAAAKARVQPTAEQAAKSPEEQEQEAFDEVKAMRREYAEGGAR